MICVAGGGRMGRGLALALAGVGERVEQAAGRPSAGRDELGEVAASATTVILAVPDDAIRGVAERLATAGAISQGQVVLHLSGLHDRSALAPLIASGAGLGSLHPLMTIASAEMAAARWRGAPAAVEGDARAVAEARRLAEVLGMVPFVLPPGAKPVYHAGAVMAANYLVTIAAAAARVARGAGIPAETADRMYLPMMRGALENLERVSAAEALTGPVRRGDLKTVGAHLASLPAAEYRLYAVLGLEAVRLAEEAGLERDTVAALRDLLERALAR